MDWLEISPHPLNLPAAVAAVTADTAGAIDIFMGITRAEIKSDGRQLLSLEYQAYEEMAQQQLQDFALRARQQWPITRLAILHRIGPVPVGQPSVIIAVSTPHRAQAFDACRWIIDTLKAELTIWKKEIWSDGPGEWVHPA